MFHLQVSSDKSQIPKTTLKPCQSHHHSTEACIYQDTKTNVRSVLVDPALTRHRSCEGGPGMRLARLPPTCGTTLPLVSHVGSEVSVSSPCIELQGTVLLALCSEHVLIDKLAQMATMMKDMMKNRQVFGLGGWSLTNLNILFKLSNQPNKDY